MSKVEIIDTNANTIANYSFCGFRNAAQEGHKRKTAWLRKRFAEGLKLKILQVDGEDAGMIEYIPGEHTWRPIDAAGYLVIHCIMINKKQFKGKGYGALLVKDCLADAERAGVGGVAVVTSSGTWMVSSDVFQRCGFECVDTSPPTYELLARKLRNLPSPRFGTGRDRTLRKYGRGLTIITSDQCPCIAKCMQDILQACKTLRIRPKVIELRTGNQARHAPSAYGIFNVIFDGNLVAEHPISGRRFLNIMRKLSG
jgi:L-amino acid N-acyltransferase YncA